MEKRTISCPGQVRLERRSDGIERIVGVASVFYDGSPRTEFPLWRGAVERIMPTAFDRAVKEDDVRALFNHDPSKILGRTKSGTLTLRVESDGLHYETEPADTSLYTDVREMLGRGDVDGSSFAFTISEGGEEWTIDEERGLDIREIRDVKLYDVGPVTYPAYEAASSGVRASELAEAKASYEANAMNLAVAQRRRLMYQAELAKFPY